MIRINLGRIKILEWKSVRRKFSHKKMKFETSLFCLLLTLHIHNIYTKFPPTTEIKLSQKLRLINLFIYILAGTF